MRPRNTLPSACEVVVAALVLTLLPACRGVSQEHHARPDDDPERLFASACSRCHGPDGRGGPPLGEQAPGPRNFHDSSFQKARTDDQLRDAIVHGRRPWMPAFESTFDDRQVRRLVEHVRRFDSKERAQ